MNKQTILKECPRHGLTGFSLRKDGVYRCKKCSSDAVQKARRKLKEKLVEYKGGKCEMCGYDKCIGAMEFHHLNPSEKEFQISNCNIKSFKRLKQEVDKCMLLCSNCHKELHYELDLKERNKKQIIEEQNIIDYEKNNKRRLKVVGRISKEEVFEKTKTMTQKQIAEFYNISVSSVKRILKS